MQGSGAEEGQCQEVGAPAEPALQEAFDLFYKKTGRQYGFVDPYRCEDAEYILVGMGSAMFAAASIVLALRLPLEEVIVRCGFGLLLNLLAYLTNDCYDGRRCHWPGACPPARKSSR